MIAPKSLVWSIVTSLRSRWLMVILAKSFISDIRTLHCLSSACHCWETQTAGQIWGLNKFNPSFNRFFTVAQTENKEAGSGCQAFYPDSIGHNSKVWTMASGVGTDGHCPGSAWELTVPCPLVISAIMNYNSLYVCRAARAV